MLATIAAVLLGAVFIVSGVSKLADPERWRPQAAELVDSRPIAVVLPLIEVAIGALLVAGWQRRWVASAAGLLLVAFTALLVVRLRQGRRPPCACFGTWSTTPLGWGHVLRNGGFIALAVIAAG